MQLGYHYEITCWWFGSYECFYVIIIEGGAMALVPFIKKQIYLPIFTSNIAMLTVNFTQMNEILGNDYEKKMAVVSVLKQYAEDRDVDMLARALAAILKTPKQTRIIQQIRYSARYCRSYSVCFVYMCVMSLIVDLLKFSQYTCIRKIYIDYIVIFFYRFKHKYIVPKILTVIEKYIH